MTIVEKIVAVGGRLAEFGADAESRCVLQQAIAQNAWFTEQNIKDSLRAIVAEMLQRDLLEEWLSHYPAPTRQPRRILVIMAGNIPAVGFADLLCVVASGHSAVVKCSSKDTPLMEYVVKLFAEYFDVQLYDGTQSVDALLAMGSDATASTLRVKFDGIPMLIRASRSSLAILTGDEEANELEGLCRDITAYDGRGCRSVSFLFVPSGYDFTELVATLAKCEVSSKWMQVYKHIKALNRMSGTPFMDAGTAVVMCAEDFPMNIATVHYAEYSSLEQVERWIELHDRNIQCVVGDVVHPRAVGFGEAQHPTLMDYPDGIDTMSFLNSI